MARGRKRDTQKGACLNRNIGVLLDMVSEATGFLAIHDLTDYLSRATGTEFKSGSVAQWRVHSTPDISLLPHIRDYFQLRLKPTPPLTIDDFFLDQHPVLAGTDPSI